MKRERTMNNRRHIVVDSDVHKALSKLAKKKKQSTREVASHILNAYFKRVAGPPSIKPGEIDAIVGATRKTRATATPAKP